jgi:outer membrane protein OmpA-like peptidoglycan-associated protein
MKLRSALLGASLLGLPAAAIAQPVTGPYVSLGAGANIFQQQDLKDVNSPLLTPAESSYLPPTTGKINTDTDAIALGSVGWGFGNGFRLEVEGDWRNNAIRSFNGLHGQGGEQAYGGFANGFYDFDLTPMGFAGLSPYVGVGVGYEEVQFHDNAGGSAVSQPVGSSVDNVFFRTSSSHGSVAVQGIVGLAYNLDAVPGLAITAEYRFTALPENEHYSGVLTTPAGSTPVGFKTDSLYSHAGLLGLRYALWQPAPPPPPVQAAPPPAPPPVQEARTYLVFFDWDRADLTARARQIVAEAAQASTHVTTTKIEVNGYTDLSGTATYNQGLSVRRAKSVEAELIRDGVPAGEIDIHGYGETNPLVPTAKGVREPQNRRVEIILH